MKRLLCQDDDAVNTEKSKNPAPRVIAWEITRRCVLACKHCRGSARDMSYDGELNTGECFKTIDSIASFCKPILILTGGEPMTRPDIYDIASYAVERGLRVVLAPCGHLITSQTARRLKDSGVSAISISIDGATVREHDEFRGVSGAYESAMEGLRHAIEAGIPFQINTTVSRQNADSLPAILEKAVELGAKTLDLFFLVPTGRAAALRDLEISAAKHEELLNWVYDSDRDSPIRVKTTCAPHYARIQHTRRIAERSKETGTALRNSNVAHPASAGCMAGQGFVFISHTGILQPCGFLDIACGDLRTVDYDFKQLYLESQVFKNLRDVSTYHGKCGVCEFRRLCGGCRARAYAHSGDYLGEEPMCAYIPVASSVL